MSRKIIGVTVGTTLPKSNLAQTDPKKGDYVKGREAVLQRIDTLEKELEEILADINYQDIAITEFKCPGAGTYELGSSVAAPKIEWSLNKDPASQNINGEALDVTDRSKQCSGSITSTKSYKLTVTGQKGEKAERTGTFTFLNGVYYGALNVGTAITSAVINAMSRSLQSGITGTFKMTATAGQKLTFAAPVSYGEPTNFKSGGLDYTWDKVATFEHENSSKHKQQYNVWQNSEITVGTFSVTVEK